MVAFPIDPFLTDIAEALQNKIFVLLKAEPGAGKTTRVPEFLLKKFNRILVVQPRRLAASLAAEWVSKQIGQAVGQVVGYQIRLEQRVSDATRLLFVTEGILTRKMLKDPLLSEYDLIILDEFHERHIHSDIALAMLKKIVSKRTDLRILIMSATLELGPLETYLGDTRVFQIPGRNFPVSCEYLALPTSARLEEQVLAAVVNMLKDDRCAGNILVFLSGYSEIMSCFQKLQSLEHRGVSIIPLTAELSSNHQKIFEHESQTKIVLATNVAETSLTLPNICGVIDTGLAKVSGFASWSGLPTLVTTRVSQASCIQRAGRAGRVAAGVCYRLFTISEFHNRPLYSEPEIRRIDLSQTLLEIQAIAPDLARAWESMDWLEAPSPEIVNKNFDLLKNLQALTPCGFLTDDGLRLAQLPLHPRLGRIVLSGIQLGCGEHALLAAVVINEGFILRHSTLARDEADCDICYQLRFFFQSGPHSGVDSNKIQQCIRVYERFRKVLGLRSLREARPIDELALRKAIFLAFADRVAKYRPLADEHKRRQRAFNFTMGRGGILSDSSVVRRAEWIVAIDAHEVMTDDSGMRARISWASKIELDWLREDPFGLLAESHEVLLEEKTGRVRKSYQCHYGKLLLNERQESADRDELTAVLLKVVHERWPQSFSDIASFHAYHGKIAILDRYHIKHKLPKFTDEYLELLLSHICDNARSVDELIKMDLQAAIESQLDYQDLQILRDYCPEHVQLDNGRKLEVRYGSVEEPWLEARIQEFFGQQETPRICRGRHPLLLKLLAPSRRPAQLTSDLRGFWAGSYHEVKKELKRRYPKHSWPDDPARDKPPEPKASSRS